MLCDHVVLTIPQRSDNFVLETDASRRGVGAVLCVERDGERLPVAFFSRQLRGAQTRYSAQELEALAIHEAIKFFSFYLLKRRFKVVTDHKSLESFTKIFHRNRRVQKWSMDLSIYTLRWCTMRAGTTLLRTASAGVVMMKKLMEVKEMSMGEMKETFI